ncbi:hypothetical protein CEXT_460101 [Caerostris extrusa]|uniref:Uncharacterized protein n=1 Tax=Caerostris extrusa TaxID=172846 RepID=A0AAV4TBW3_CAEEX|nr:hypothetical protein CEXT_460101 [Caerostris extrusa]
MSCWILGSSNFLPMSRLASKMVFTGIQGNLGFCCISNESLGVCKGNVAGSCSVTFIVGDDLDIPMLEHTDT